MRLQITTILLGLTLIVFQAWAFPQFQELVAPGGSKDHQDHGDGNDDYSTSEPSVNEQGDLTTINSVDTPHTINNEQLPEVSFAPEPVPMEEGLKTSTRQKRLFFHFGHDHHHYPYYYNYQYPNSCNGRWYWKDGYWAHGQWHQGSWEYRRPYCYYRYYHHRK